MKRSDDPADKSAPSASQALATVGGAFLATWVASRLTTSTFMLLTVVGGCTEQAISGCVLFSWLAPATGIATAMLIVALLLRRLGPIRNWQSGGMALAFVSFIVGACWQGWMVVDDARTPRPAGVSDNLLSGLQPWLPALLCTAVVLCWFVLLRVGVARRRNPGKRDDVGRQ